MSNRWLYRLRRWPFLIRGIIRFLLWLRGDPVPYLFIENFEAGLDTRKSRYTAPPGSLRQCVNAHITRGKEIEKRKAFVEYGDVDGVTTRSLHSVGQRLFTFTSWAAVTDYETPPGVDIHVLGEEDDFFGDLRRVWFAENFAGKIYTIAEDDSGRVKHFYDGVEVTDWNTIAADLASRETVARALATRLEGAGRFSVTVRGRTIEVRSFDPDPTFVVEDVFPEGARPEFTEVQAGQAPVAAVAAEAEFSVLDGTEDPGVNTVSKVILDGFDLIGSPIDHTGNNDTTAQAVADRINEGTLYTASRIANTVRISADPALGASANGRVLEVEGSGDVVVGDKQNMSGGADTQPGQISIWTIEIQFFDPNTIYWVRVESEDPDSTVVSVTGRGSAMPLAVRTLGQKMYAVTGSLVYFSGFRGGYDGANQTPALPDPTAWQNFDDTTTEYVIGAGILSLSEQVPFSEDAVGLGVYQGRLAVFSRRSIQIWEVDPDPDLNRISQVLLNIGSIAPRSITEYGDQDIFFLSESGVRSLRARDSSNIASTSDVGSPIEQQLLDYMRGLSADQIRQAVSVVEPENGRYLLSIGARVYAFSSFPASRVSAWSRYSIPSVETWAVAGRRLFYRKTNPFGDTLVPVYLYGGQDGETYDDSPVTVELPFLDAGNPAGEKALRGIDLGVEGRWKVEFASEPNNPEARETIAEVTESTYGSFPQVKANGVSTHFSLLLTNEDEGPAVLANAIIHYDDIKAD